MIITCNSLGEQDEATKWLNREELFVQHWLQVIGRLGHVSVYLQTHISCFFYEFTNNIIPVHRLFLNPRYGERSTSTYPLLPDANVGQYSTSKVIFTPKSFINSAIRNVPSPQDIVMGCAAKTSYPGCVRRPNLPCAHYIWHYMMEHLCLCLVHVGVVLMYFGRQ